MNFESIATHLLAGIDWAQGGYHFHHEKLTAELERVCDQGRAEGKEIIEAAEAWGDALNAEVIDANNALLDAVERRRAEGDSE